MGNVVTELGDSPTVHLLLADKIKYPERFWPHCIEDQFVSLIRQELFVDSNSEEMGRKSQSPDGSPAPSLAVALFVANSHDKHYWRKVYLLPIQTACASGEDSDRHNFEIQFVSIVHVLD